MNKKDGTKPSATVADGGHGPLSPCAVLTLAYLFVCILWGLFASSIGGKLTTTSKAKASPAISGENRDVLRRSALRRGVSPLLIHVLY